MDILTIDPKENCYVIDPNQMEYLQNNVAASVTLDRGTHVIRITSGRYSFSSSQTTGEPWVVLWMYGVDGSTFTNKNTGATIGATWTTLNGYDDTLTLEVSDRVVVCALFFDYQHNSDASSIELAIGSQTLTVESQKNRYLLDRSYLDNLKKWKKNFIEVDPGIYRIKIRDGQFSYWSDDKKFDLEPWALLWAKGGKVIAKNTDVEVEETWCSLNGYNDYVEIEVKAKTTLCGLFFDTYKDDNEGKITLSISPIPAKTRPTPPQPETHTDRIPTTPVSKVISSPIYIPDNIWDLRDPATDVVCISPVRTIVRREEEIILVRKVRKVEEIDASPACPVNSMQMDGVQIEN
ncbi:hypothetical protein IQ235_05820 [Oscillatoriales cyanobacterium LEGE 11467]|uniref:Uncharacterized protein n=1 Tax=Zarconia navalis LEGE 11467 TaxID=1828826 RepID=A0A928VTZ1_9CYAN|nr:hypothetical protein [Zarconia navalis]MBE9040309.1 hypothetical protein [Zarconia navalis LEGE 11467]